MGKDKKFHTYETDEADSGLIKRQKAVVFTNEDEENGEYAILYTDEDKDVEYERVQVDPNK